MLKLHMQRLKNLRRITLKINSKMTMNMIKSFKTKLITKIIMQKNFMMMILRNMRKMIVKSVLIKIFYYN